MIDKKSMLRQRLAPKIWDEHYITTTHNLNAIKTLAKIIKNKDIKILDIGCGYKPFKTLFTYKEYIGIDFDKKTSDADIVVDCNNNKLPFKNETFDVVIIADTLEHIYNTELILSEIKRVLNHSGLLYISTPFMFCEHGVPHDYYRFTRHFYLKKFAEYKILCFKQSSSFLSSPLIITNQLLEHLPIGFLRVPFVIFNNIIIQLLEILTEILNNILQNKTMKDGFKRGYEETTIILRKA